MRAPKHLWSGDWERESAALSEELAGARAPARAPTPAPVEPTPQRPPARDSRPAPRRRWRRWRPRRRPRFSPALGVALVTILVLAAAGYGISRLVGTASSPAQTTSAAAASAGGPIDWLGMQIEGITPGTVVIATVAPGSQGELAGLEPGDQLQSVNGRSINTTSDIAAAIAGLQPGDTVQIQVSRGSTPVATQATLGAPPSNHP